MSHHRDFRVIAAALLLAWGFYTHYKNKRLSKTRPDAELQVLFYPKRDRPNDPKTRRFDTLVFVTILAIIAVISIANSDGCR
jgi:hypothetical protein